MTERSVSVRLIALTSQYDSAMRHSGQVTRDLGVQAELAGTNADGARGRFDQFGGAVDNSGRKAERAAPQFSALGLGIAAALPALPAVIGGTVALGAALTTAGTAALGTGLVLKTALGDATKASQQLLSAQQAVNDATTKASRTTALEKQAALIKTLGPDVIALSQATSDLSGQWKTFADSFTPNITASVAEVSKLGEDVLPQLQPMIANTFGVLDKLLTQMNAAATGAGGQAFFKWLSTEGPRDLLAIADAAGHVGAGLAHIAVAFTPVEHQLLSGIESITAKFDTWSSTLGTNSGFQNFLSTVEKDGPILVKTLGDVASAIGHMGLSLGGVLPMELRFIDDIANLISTNPALAKALALMYLGFESLKVINTITAPLRAVVDIAAAGTGKLLGFAAAEDAMGASAGGLAGKLAGLLPMLSALGPLLGIAAGAWVEYNMAASGSGARAKTQQYVQNQAPGDPWAGMGPDSTPQLPSSNGWTSAPTTTIDGWTVPTSSTVPLGHTTVGMSTVTGLSGTYSSQVPNAAGTNRSSDYNQQVPGGATSVYGNPKAISPSAPYLAQFNSQLNNPSNMLPYSAGGGGSKGKTAAQLALAAITAQDDLLNAQALAAIDPTNKLALAQEAVVDATRRLNNETTKGSLAYYQDLTTLHQAQASLNDEIKAEAQARADAQKQLAADTKAEADLLAQEATTTAQFYADLAAAAATHAANDKKLLDQRQADIENFSAANQQAVTQWGSSLTWLSANVENQADQITKWQTLLAQARSRGVSNDVIAALGLDQGPQALGQLQQFSTATQDQIDALNKAVGDKNAAAGAEVTTEAVNNFGALGQALIAEQQSYADAATAIQTKFASDMASLAQQVQQAQATIGTDQQTLNALPAQYGHVANMAALAALPQGTALYTRSADGSYVHIPSMAALGAMPAGTPVYDKLYDSGGILPPGKTVAYNASGRSEFVFTQDQLAAMSGNQAPTAVHVYIGDQELKGIVRAELVSANGARRQAILVGGTR